MASETNAPLSEAEFHSLLALTGGGNVEDIPAEHRKLFIRLGFLRKIGTEFRVTSTARLRAMQGR